MVCALGVLVEAVSVAVDLSRYGSWTGASQVHLLTGVVYAVLILCLVADATAKGKR